MPIVKFVCINYHVFHFPKLNIDENIHLETSVAVCIIIPNVD